MPRFTRGSRLRRARQAAIRYARGKVDEKARSYLPGYAVAMDTYEAGSAIYDVLRGSGSRSKNPRQRKRRKIVKSGKPPARGRSQSIKTTNMVRYGRKRSKRLLSKSRRSRRRKGRKSSRRGRPSVPRGLRLLPLVRPMTKTIKLRHVQHVHLNPAKSRWGFFKFYPANLTNQILQDSVNWNASETSFTPMWHQTGARRKWLDLWAYQQTQDADLYSNPDVKAYGRFDATGGGLSVREPPSSVRGFSTISTHVDLKMRPQGFDQWMGPAGTNNEYHKYKVLGAKITMEHVPGTRTSEGTVMYMGFTKQDRPDHTLIDQTKNVDASEVADFINGGYIKKGGFKIFGSGTIGTKVTGHYSAKKAIRQLKRGGLADINAQYGTTTAPPALDPALNFVVAMPGQGDPGDQTFLLTCEYVIRLSDITPPAQSLSV